MKLAIVNPNTDAAVTRMMVDIAARDTGANITGFTAPFGARLITNPVALAEAALAVRALAPQLADFDGVIVAAFGDPGLAELRAALSVPITGIGEAAMHAAGRDRRRFAVVTTTPDLCAAISENAARGGYSRFAGVWLTKGDACALTADPARLLSALHLACEAAVAEGGAEAIIIGGGPLSEAAEALRGALSVPVIAPITEAVQLALQRSMRAA